MFRITADFPDFDSIILKRDGKDIANVAAGIIADRTEQGLGFVNNYATTLPPLRASSVRRRERYRGRKGSGFNPKRSNLTLTGGLLRSIKGRQRRYDGRIVVADTRAVSRRRGLRSTELVPILEERGFRFFDITFDELKILEDFYNDLLLQRIEKITD